MPPGLWLGLSQRAGHRSLQGEPAGLALSSELGTGKGDRGQPGHPVAGAEGLLQLLSGPPWQPLSPALTTGHWVLCPAAQQRPCSRGQASAGGGHGARLAPTCNRGALVFVSCSLARAPPMSGAARLFPCPSSLHGRVQPGLAPPLGGRRVPPALGPPQPGARPYPVNRGLPALCRGSGPSVPPSHRRGRASQPGAAGVPPGSCCCADWLPQGGAGPHGHL